LRAAATISVAVTAAALTAAAGFTPAMAAKADGPVLLTGQVWNDANGDGIKTAAEQKNGVAGVTITVRYADGTPLTQVTGADGKYKFEKLRAAEVDVTVTPPISDLEWHFSPTDATKDEQNDSDFVSQYNKDAEPPYTGVDHVKLQGEHVKRDAGISSDGDIPQPTGTGVVQGKVWNDKNRNGVYDKGSEQGVAGLPVLLFAGVDETPAPGDETTTQELVKRLAARPHALADAGSPVTTDHWGNYRFGKVLPGSYFIAIPPGPVKDGDTTDMWKFTKANVGTDDTIDSDVTVNETEDLAMSKSFTIDAKTQKVEIDAGVYTGPDPQPTASSSEGPGPVPTPSASIKPTPKPTPSVSASASAVPTASAVPAPGGGGSLPVTGAAIGGIVSAAVLLIGGGVALTVLARRRRGTPTA
jgi:hypothetical protein